MEVLGQEHGGVVSLSPHPTRPQSGFASLSGVGCVSLYDQRLRSRRYASITNTNIIAHTEAMELQFLSEHLVMAVSGPLIQVMDLRKQQLLHEYQHTSDVAQVLQEIPPPGASVTLFVDDDGHVIPFNTQSGCTTTAVEAHVFGTQMVLGGSYFGQLPNLCSGLGVVRCDARMDEEEHGTRGGGGGTHHQCLVGLSMDSEGVVFRGVNPQDQLMFSVPDESAGVCAAVSGQLVNPPLANCCSFDGGNRMAVGRANGMYAIVEVHPTEVLELLAAPGHGTNGLCHVGWCNHGRDLVTVSLCGDVSMWAITDFINTEPAANTNEEEEEEGELPELRLALSHRDVTMPSSIINTGVVVANSLALLVGDTNGFISRCSLEA